MKTVLNVNGMSCAHCVRHVTTALEELDGVSGAVVSLEQNTASVEHDESVTSGQLKAAVEDAGYEVV